MEVDQSLEDYFRQNAAAALLQNDEDSSDDNAKSSNANESWSDVEDASASEDDDAILQKKRILRYGRKKLSVMRERFNAAKKRLYEAKQRQLDVEWAQLQSGTLPQYKEFADQLEARWSDRLSKIDQEVASIREFARVKLEASRKATYTTFIASRAELRRTMIYSRKQQIWSLTDDLRTLEKVREAIASITYPLSSHSKLTNPLPRPAAAPTRSSHLLAPPPTRLSRIDEDSDVSTILGIPSLLNYPDADAAADSGVIPDSSANLLDSAAPNAAADSTAMPSDSQQPHMPVAGYGPDDRSTAPMYKQQYRNPATVDEKRVGIYDRPTTPSHLLSVQHTQHQQPYAAPAPAANAEFAPPGYSADPGIDPPARATAVPAATVPAPYQRSYDLGDMSANGTVPHDSSGHQLAGDGSSASKHRHSTQPPRPNAPDATHSSVGDASASNSTPYVYESTHYTPRHHPHSGIQPAGDQGDWQADSSRYPPVSRTQSVNETGQHLPPPYYNSSVPSVPSAPSQPPAPSAYLKRDASSEYDNASSNKRQRVVPSSTWPSTQQQQQHQQQIQHSGYYDAPDRRNKRPWEDTPADEQQQQHQQHSYPEDAPAPLPPYGYDEPRQPQQHEQNHHSYHQKYTPQPASTEAAVYSSHYAPNSAHQYQQAQHHNPATSPYYRRPAATADYSNGTDAQKPGYSHGGSSYYQQQPHHSSTHHAAPASASGPINTSAGSAWNHPGPEAANGATHPLQSRQTDQAPYFQAPHYQHEQQRQPPHLSSHQSDSYYRDHQDHRYQQQPPPPPAAAAGYGAPQSEYHSSTSYSGLDSGIAMPPPVSPREYHSRYQQHNASTSGQWSEYYQQQQQAPRSYSQQHQQPMLVHSPPPRQSSTHHRNDYYDQGGYYRDQQQQQQQQRPTDLSDFYAANSNMGADATASGQMASGAAYNCKAPNDPHQYQQPSSLANILK